MVVPSRRLTSGLRQVVTLGVMLDWVSDPYQMGILAGILDAAANAGANVLCFAGGRVPMNSATSARHRVFQLIGRHNVDALVVLAAALMHEVGLSGIRSYCADLIQNLPYCTFGVEMEGVPSVVANSKCGMRDLVSHLVDDHGCRRFAFVRGPIANVEAEERFMAFQQGLEAEGIALDPELVAVGDFLAPSGAEAVGRFSRVAGTSLKDLDAIVAANDEMAVGVLQALDAKGISVPGSIAVTGFDDEEEARLAPAPLTTVRQSLEKIGRLAANNMLNLAQVGTAPESLVVDTELVVRRSCGCSANRHVAKHSTAPDLKVGFEAAIVLRREHIIHSLSRAGRGALGRAGSGWEPRMLDAFLAEMSDAKPGAFRCMIENLAETSTAHRSDIQVCHDVVQVLRRQVSITMRSDLARRDKAEEIFYASHLALAEIDRRGLSRETLRLGRWGRDVADACNGLTNAFDFDELHVRIHEVLPTIGITTYYVVVYCPTRGRTAARLIVASDKGRPIPLPADSEFDGAQLLPASYKETIRDGRAYVVIPCTWKDISLGHIIVDLNPAHAFCYDVVADAIASGLYGSRLAATA